MEFGTLIDGNIQYAKPSRYIDGTLYTKLSLAQHLALGEKPVYDLPPPAASSAGFHWEKDGWKVQPAAIVRKWKPVEDPPAQTKILISKSKVEAAIDKMNLTSEFNAWLQSKASYFGGWMRSGDVIEYDPLDNASDLAGLLEALGISQEQVPSLIEEVRA